MHVVVMFEPEIPGENLTPMGQLNEVFGPFENEEKACAWVERMQPLIKNRMYLVAQLSDPAVVNKLDPATN